MSDVFDIAKKAAIVTGGNVGIGKAIARRYLECGASVVTCSRREYDSPPAAEGMEGVEGRIFHLTCDVREPDQVDAVVRKCMDEFGRLDVLVNNAGGSPGAPLATASPNFFDKVIKTNLLSVLIFSQRANAIMQSQDGGGVIINISSTAGTGPAPMLGAYGAAKAGVINVTRTMAVEWGPKVRLACIAPGLILTEGADYLAPTPEAKQQAAEGIPLKRIGEPEDIADICIFLASDAARYISGETIVVDGGPRVPRVF